MQTFDRYARYYDLLYEGKDYAGEARFVADALRRHDVAHGSMLDLGCGTGRHALEFAAMGFEVQGVDLSDAMVEQARKRIPLQLRDRMTFGVGDARTVRVGRQFDAVVSLFHVASYQSSNDDVLRMFATAATHLRPGGIFLFDCWYGPAVLTDRPAVRVKRLSDGTIEVTRVAEPVLYPNLNIVDVQYTVHIVDKATRHAEEVKETHRMRYYFTPELHLFLMDTGFEPVATVEWMSGEPLDFSTWSATVVARKQ